MEPRTLRLLELDKVLTRLDNATASALGSRRVRALKPSTDAVEVRRRLAETSETRRFEATGKSPTFGGVGDISSQLQHAAIGSILEPGDLLAAAHLAAGARRLREVIVARARDEFPILHGYIAHVTPRPDIEKAITEAIDETSGDVKDNASLRLLKARRNIRQTQADIQSRLRNMLADPNVQPLLQDNFVTVRDGRYCLPVKAESRARVPGIVHDRSGSGAAFFVEPQAIVDMNNRLRELMLEEREAILEILRLLTQRVAGAQDDLQAAMQACENLDFAFAKAHLSRAMDALEPAIEDDPARTGFALLQARHPLVEECVPNDIYLGSGFGVRGSGDVASEGPMVRGRDTGDKESVPAPSTQHPEPFDVMLITGPNTGGKTVVLKTLGLLTCMAACGLHLPVAAGSRLSLPGAVYADIGDEQSIEQSLSTFSSHMKQIIHILRRARTSDLVLLDEVGAGTDPDEGAALAKAVLRALQRRGVRVVATTHYGELKQFALGSERFENASVEFDARSLRPTYHLRIGVPGASNALDIAARLGMPPELVQRARRYLGRDRVEAEVATQRLEETQRELEQQTANTQRERAEVERLRRDYEGRLERLQARMDEQLAGAQREAVAQVRQVQEEADSILRELRSAAKESKQTEEARRRLRTLRERVEVEGRRGEEHKGRTTKKENERKGDEATSVAEAGSPFPQVGELVRVVSFNKEGTLLSTPGDDGRVEVRVGAIKVHVPARDIEAMAQPKSTVGGVSAIRLRKAVTVPEEINLIGKTTDEALPELEKYLDDALLAEAEQVRVVHGRGSGALRAAIHRWLKSQRAVRQFHLAPQNEGGEGATIVYMG